MPDKVVDSDQVEQQIAEHQKQHLKLHQKHQEQHLKLHQKCQNIKNNTFASELSNHQKLSIVITGTWK